MVPSMSSFIVLFQSPFWVGIAQRWGEEGYQAAKITFGAQPTDTQIYQWVLKEWHRLVFSKLSEEESPVLERKQKRLQREARKAIQVRGMIEGWPEGKRSIWSVRRRTGGNSFSGSKKSAKKSGADNSAPLFECCKCNSRRKAAGQTASVERKQGRSGFALGRGGFFAPTFAVDDVAGNGLVD